ncbi:MAG: STT3 domain-containing protein [Candidatus Pacearchaeota archaeon]
MEDDKLLEERKEKLISFLKKDRIFSTFLIIALLSLICSILAKTAIIGFLSASLWLYLAVFSAISAAFAYFKLHKLIFYPILAWIVWLAVYIRTLNLPLLRDVTTGGWTLGPDLDPFLFLRWAKYIVTNGAIMAHDAMRYVPLGYNTSEELVFLSYLIAWFHKIALMFGSTSVEQSAALFPAFMFALTIIAFFFLVRKIFLSSMGDAKSSVIALISCFFLSVIPVFIPRTIAGIPEKESAAFVFFFLALCFFLYAWQSKKAYAGISLSILSGISTGLMALVWGGYFYIFMILGISVFLAFLFEQVSFNKFVLYFIWLISTIISYIPFTNKYSLQGILVSPTTGIAFIVFAVILIDNIIYKTSLKNISEKFPKIPRPIISLVFALLAVIVITSLVFGPGYVIDKISEVYSHLITPVADRLGVTVAENKQPFFSEWADSFGPKISGIPVTFWLFFFGSVYLFYNMLNILSKKERIILTLSYFVFLLCLIFSRYSSSSVLNGVSGLSIFLYVLGVIILIGTFGFYYFAEHKKEEKRFKHIEFGLILLFSLFVLSIISARGAIRLVMMLAPPASIIVSYFTVSFASKSIKIKDNAMKFFAVVLAILIVILSIFAANQFYKEAVATGSNYAPSAYNQQWQKAMSWVRENTPKDAVFAHWWDYGYWLQSIGERATVLDGGNAIPYWNHLMGRHALTGQSDEEPLEYLYTHNATHFLIDSTDIGKYPAFSSIGSDENYDRYSWLTPFAKDSSKTQETKNTTISVYFGGMPIDGDIIYNNGDEKIFLPGEKAGLGAVMVEKNNKGEIISNPIGIFVYQNKQYKLPLRYAFENKLIDFNSGINAGIFLMPYIQQSAEGVRIDKDGALIYLSDRTVKSQLARLYLYNEDDKYFKLVHSEDDFVVEQLKNSNVTNKDIVYFGGIRGPIRIWEINYPSGMKINEEFLQKNYPDIKLSIAR